MKKIWLQAYSHGNFGDDLFIYIITKRYPNQLFFLPCEYASEELRKIKNLKILKSTIFAKAMHKLKSTYFPFKTIARTCDVGVILGGSMFIERPNWEKNVDYYDMLKKIIPQLFLIGSNFGPYTTIQYKERYENLFKKFTDCCFRDKYSQNLFRKESNIRYAPDVAFLLDKECTIKMPGKIVISVVNLKYKKGIEKYYNQYINVIKKMCIELKQKGNEVILLSLCEEQGDYSCCQDIGEKIGIPVIAYSNKLKEVIDCIASAEYIVATRFHSMILGWIYNCKVFPIIYDEKTKNVLRDFDWTEEVCTLDELGKITGEYVLENAHQLFNIQKIKKSAQNQFEALDKVLSE